MTVETAESNEMQESAGGEFEGKHAPESVAEEGQARSGMCNGIACREAEGKDVAKDDVDGSYVFVNRESNEPGEIGMIEKADLDGNRKAEPTVELGDPSEGDLGEDIKVEITTDVNSNSVEISALMPTADEILDKVRVVCGESTCQSEEKGNLITSTDETKFEDDKGALTTENGYHKETCVSNSYLDVAEAVVQEEKFAGDALEACSVPQPFSLTENEVSTQEKDCEESFGYRINNHDVYEGETTVYHIGTEAGECPAAASFEIKDGDSKPIFTETSGSISPSFVNGEEVISVNEEDRIPALEQSEAVVLLTKNSELLPPGREDTSVPNGGERSPGSEPAPSRSEETAVPNNTEDFLADRKARIACTESRSEALSHVDVETLATNGTGENLVEYMPFHDGEGEGAQSKEQSKIMAAGGSKSILHVKEEPLASNIVENNTPAKQPKLMSTEQTGQMILPLGGQKKLVPDDMEENSGAEQSKIVVIEISETEAMPLDDGELVASTEDNVVAEQVRMKVVEGGQSESLSLMDKEKVLTSISEDKTQDLEQFAQSMLEPESEFQSIRDLHDKSSEDTEVTPSEVDEVKTEDEKSINTQVSSENQPPSFPVTQPKSVTENVDESLEKISTCSTQSQESMEKHPSHSIRQTENFTEITYESPENSDICPIGDEVSTKGVMTFADNATIKLKVDKEVAESEEDVSGRFANDANSKTVNEEAPLENKTYPSSLTNQMNYEPREAIDPLKNQACVSDCFNTEIRLEKSGEISLFIAVHNASSVTKEECKEEASASLETNTTAASETGGEDVAASDTAPSHKATPIGGMVGGENVTAAPDAIPICPVTNKDIPDSVVENVIPESEIGSKLLEHGKNTADSIQENQPTDKDDPDTLTSSEIPTEKESENNVIESAVEEPGTLSLPGQKVDTDIKHQVFYVIKIPRFSDDKLKVQIQSVQQEVDEKTRSRDSIRVAMQKQKAICAEHWQKVEEARKEERVTRDAVASKRQEIDSIQSVLNKLKNASSLADIDDQIHKLQHRISHETNTLKEEKSLIREINQLKQSREHLSSSLASEMELQEAFEKQEQMETRTKLLKEEIDVLRKDALQAEAYTKDAKRKYDNQCQSLRDLQLQFRAADDLRQEAYTKLRNLKHESYVKNEYFYLYKDDLKVATTYSFSGDKEALRAHCTNQIEKIMELWNKNVEFRHQYVKANMASTLRRFKTLDARSLGPDEEPTVMYGPRDQKENTMPVPVPKNDFPALATERKQERAEAPVSAAKMSSTNAPAVAQKSQPPKSKGVTKHPPAAEVASFQEDNQGEKETERSIEEEEQARKVKEQARREEELRKEAAAAELRERLRLEQIAKAKEAEERKKRKVEKAQAKAEVRAQKEAKLREKKKQKKDRRYAAENAGEAELLSLPVESETMSESSVSEQPEKTAGAGTPSKRSSKSRVASYNSKVKPLPPPLRNRSKRKMQSWMWALLAVLAVLALFMAGNYISFSKLGPLSFNF